MKNNQYIFLVFILLSCTKELIYTHSEEEALTPKIEEKGDSVSVSLSAPGTLSLQLSDMFVMDIKTLIVEGSLNGTDLKLIREMAGCDSKGNETEGKLRKLNLSKAHLVKGGDAPFIYNDTPCNITKDNVIPYFGFAYCKLKEIILPEDIVEFYSQSFYHCDSLTTINIPTSLRRMGWSVFLGCSSLSCPIVIPEGVLEINNYAFYGCEELNEIVLPNTIESIRYAGFADCENITSLGSDLPQLKCIEEYAFYKCRKLKSATIPKEMDSIPRAAFYDCRALTYADISGKKKIGKYAFYGCSMLKSIHLSTPLEEIGDSAFYDAGLTMDLVLPSSVKYIGYGAFNSTNVTSVEICSDIQTNELAWGVGHFGSCKNLRSVKVREGCKRLELSFSNCSSLVDVQLPEQLKNLPAFAFNSCTALSHIHIPETVTEIGAYALSGLEKLENIQLPSRLLVIPQGLLSGCTSLRNIEIPAGVTLIDYEAFEKTGLTTITLPKGVAEIDRYAFRECKGLQSINLPAALKKIGDGAFSECASLKDINVDSNCKLEEIRDNAFFKCSDLKEISLPSTVTTIGNYAFSTTGLTDITLPATLTIIGDQCFAHCGRLSSITNLSIIPQEITVSVFEGLALNTITLKVPLESIDSYKKMPVWGDFSKIIAM